MSEEEKAKEASSYPYVVSENPVTALPEQSVDEPNRRRLLKKRMVQLLCVVLLLILIITIAFVLILLFVPSRQFLINNTTHRVVGERTVDEVEFVDNKESVMQYLLRKTGEQVDVILDLNRNLEIMKITKDSGWTTCFVSPILALDPKSTPVGNDTNNGTTDDMDIKSNSSKQSAVVDFKRSSDPIRDKSILGPKGVALCRDTEVYWSIPQCSRDARESQQGEPSSSSAGSGGRKKRGDWYPWCRWDWTNCYYFSFWDEPYRSYYRCAILCTWVWY